MSKLRCAVRLLSAFSSKILSWCSFVSRTFEKVSKFSMPKEARNVSNELS